MMLDRAIRADANILFCGRSGLAFEYQLQPSIINNWYRFWILKIYLQRCLQLREGQSESGMWVANLE